MADPRSLGQATIAAAFDGSSMPAQGFGRHDRHHRIDMIAITELSIIISRQQMRELGKGNTG
jgi:hypothetical protein